MSFKKNKYIVIKEAVPKLIAEFVYSKLNILVKEISLSEDFEIVINSDKEILLNQKLD